MCRLLFALWFALAAGAASLQARGGGGCVAEGTLIDTPNGPRAIESLQVGDAVWSQVAGQRVGAQVQAVYQVAPAEFIELTTSDTTLLVTAEHPVQTDTGVFVRADHLAEATNLFTPTARTPLTRFRHLAADRPAYNLLVSPGGVFFANGLLVHNKGCFLPDTPITMADGRQQAISTIRIGDRVLAFTPDGLPSPATVHRILTHEVESYLVIRTPTTELRVTEEHPFYVGNGAFRTIESLHVGDAIHAFDGAGQFTSQRLLAMERRREPVTVYNLEVDAPHTYLANGIAVHNKGGGCFAPGTRITTPGGSRVIESLQIGDLVLAPEPDGRLVPAEISGAYLNYAPLRILHTDGGDLRTTDEHPLLSADGRFVAATELGIGANLVRAGGVPAAIHGVSRTTESGPVYTLQVSGPHTFVADGFVVHNKGGGGGSSGFRAVRVGGGSSGSSGSANPISSFVFFAVFFFIVAVILSKVLGGGRADDEDLDYCFSRAAIEAKSAKTHKLLEFIARTDPKVTPTTLVQTVDRTFRKLQECWSARDYQPMQPLLMPDLWAQHHEQLQGLRQNHEINRLESLRVEQIDLVHLNYTDKPEGRAFTALITAWLRDTYVDDRTGEFLRGDDFPARFQEFWTFQYWEGEWRLREIEQSRESDYLKIENFFESFTETGRDQVYGETAGQAGPVGPSLPAEVQTKDANIDRLLNFLVVTDKIWDREAMLSTARRAFTGVLLAWQDGRPDAFMGLPATPELLAQFKATNTANTQNQWRIEYRNFCVRKVEIIHVNNRDDRNLDEYTVRLSAHAQRIATRAGAVIHADPYVTPWVEFWTFRRSDRRWLLSEVLPSGQGARLVGTENVDEGSSQQMLEWYYSKERAT